MNFSIAMHNELRRASYDQPANRGTPLYEFLIVQRPGGDILTISDAGGADEAPPPKAPDHIRPNNTLIGTLIARDTERGEEIFIFNRHAPENLAVPGDFFPADGFAVIGTEDG